MPIINHVLWAWMSWITRGAESCETLLNVNDNEQYRSGNNLRICALSPDTGADCPSSAISFITNVMRINTITESNIEVAHMITRPVQLPNSQAQRRRPVMLVRFNRKDDRDMIITARKVLNGTRYAITEDLTGLNMKTMNRLRNHDQVRTVWSWKSDGFYRATRYAGTVSQIPMGNACVCHKFEF